MRRLLRQTMRRAAKKGFSFQVGPESEFYLFRTGEDGSPMLAPHDHAGYFDIAPVDRGENIRREICLVLEEMGVQPSAAIMSTARDRTRSTFTARRPSARLMI